jgi:uncharacterized membrane protein
MPLSANNYSPQVISLRRPLTGWLIVLGGALVFVSLIIAAPLLAASGHSTSALSIYHAFSFLCHQLPDRSFFIDGHKLAVCSRCTGLYFGAALTLLAYPLLRSLRVAHPPDRKWLFAAAIPLLIDFFLTFLGIWENTHTTRFVTGFIFSSVVVFYVMPGVVELSLRSWQRQLSSQPEVAPVVGRSIPVGPSDYSAPERRI